MPRSLASALSWPPPNSTRSPSARTSNPLPASSTSSRSTPNPSLTCCTNRSAISHNVPFSRGAATRALETALSPNTRSRTAGNGAVMSVAGNDHSPSRSRTAWSPVDPLSSRALCCSPLRSTTVGLRTVHPTSSRCCRNAYPRRLSTSCRDIPDLQFVRQMEGCGMNDVQDSVRHRTAVVPYSPCRHSLSGLKSHAGILHCAKRRHKNGSPTHLERRIPCQNSRYWAVPRQ